MKRKKTNPATQVNDPYFLKQVIFKNEGEIEDRQEIIYEAMQELLPIGKEVSVRRGRGIWVVEVAAILRGKYAGEFTAYSKTGKYHTFSWDKIVDL